MRVREVMVLRVNIRDRLFCLLIRNAIAGQYFFEGMEFSIEDLQDADEVAGVSYVDSIGEGGYGLSRRIFARLKIGRHYCIGMAGRDEMLNGQARSMRQQAGADIPEIPAGNAD